MLIHAIFFLVVALVAGVLGYCGGGGTVAWIAKILFVSFLFLSAISMIVWRKSEK